MRPIPFGDLTPEQQAFADMPLTKNSAVIGAPGSGKSLVLVHRAVRLIERGLVAPERLRIVTYTNALESYIRAGLKEWGLPADMVISYDALMRDLHLALTGEHFPRPAKGSDADLFNGQREAVHALVVDGQTLFEVEPRWDVVLVDETQDLAAQDVETLVKLSRHVSVAMDTRQQLYRRGGDAVAILKVLGLRWESASLLSTFRCSQSVLQLAARVAPSAEDRRFLPDTVGRTSEEIPSFRLLADDRDMEDDFMIEALKSRTSAGRSCAVLVPTSFFAGGIAKALAEAGLAVEGPKKIDITSDAIKVMTYHAAKGLSFDSVFLPRLSESQLGKVGRHTNRASLLFVALTRATTYVFMSATAGQEAAEWHLFDGMSEEHLQTGSPTVGSSTAAPVPAPIADSESDLDDFL